MNSINTNPSRVAGLICALLLCAPAYGVTLSLVPASTTVTTGDTVAVDLVISDLDSSGAVLGGFDTNLLFDPAILSFSGYTLDLSLGDVAAFSALDASFGVIGAGIVNIAEVSFLADAALASIQGDSFVLATLNFAASGAGTSVLDFGSTLLSDGLGDPLGVGATLGASITVQAIPLPAPVWLLGSGLLVLLRLRREASLRPR